MSSILYHYGPENVDLTRLHALLGETYWAKGRPLAQIAAAVRASFCVSAFAITEDSAEERQVGFARLVTDFAIVAYLADVIVDPAWRDKGIGTTMVRKLVEHEAVATCNVTLHTRDAHGVYRPFGFNDWMSLVRKTTNTWSEGRP